MLKVVWQGHSGAMSDIAFHTSLGSNRIAYRFLPGPGPALVFLPGYKSDMAGGKACAVFEWARENGRACLLLDYSGCGQSDGNFADGTLTRWVDEVRSVIGATGIADMILIGSSMGGWLMLLTALSLGKRVKGLIGIAAAPDFTDWGYDSAQKALLAAGTTVLEDNAYGPQPTPTHPAFWADGQRLLVLGETIAIDCPVRLLHGQADGDVPWDISLRLAARLRSADVQVILIKDGDHRLSRPAEIDLMLRTVAALPASAGSRTSTN